jgi:hypothetical protein
MRWLLAMLLLAGCVPTGERLADRFAAEYRCDRAGVAVERLPANAFLVNGCGRTRSFACLPGRYPPLCTEEGGYRP